MKWGAFSTHTHRLSPIFPMLWHVHADGGLSRMYQRFTRLTVLKHDYFAFQYPIKKITIFLLILLLELSRALGRTEITNKIWTFINRMFCIYFHPFLLIFICHFLFLLLRLALEISEIYSEFDAFLVLLTDLNGLIQPCWVVSAGIGIGTCCHPHLASG